MQISKLVLQTPALHQVKHFYGSVLELPVLDMAEDTIMVQVGTTRILFEHNEKGAPFYHFAINIPANKIVEAKEWLEDKVKLIWIDDYKSNIADFVNWHAKAIYFYDPAGNVVELIARFDLANDTDEPFSSYQFLSVSELGLVFPENELEPRTREIQNSYGLSLFQKQPALPQFKALGDDEGLFIIVPENRNWYPTQKPSGIWPVQIEFENEDGKYTASF